MFNTFPDSVAGPEVPVVVRNIGLAATELIKAIADPKEASMLPRAVCKSVKGGTPILDSVSPS
jgi:hypothetical protein